MTDVTDPVKGEGEDRGGEMYLARLAKDKIVMTLGRSELDETVREYRDVKFAP